MLPEAKWLWEVTLVQILSYPLAATNMLPEAKMLPDALTLPEAYKHSRSTSD